MSADHSKYTGATFTCLDGSATFSSSLVNDDYCDCADSSDEPGTSACPSASFFCSNKGATSLVLPSSRVNDFICDCCDGSDEWEGKKEGGCPNTCAELGRALHQHVLDEIAATDAGVALRQQLIAEAQQLKRDKEAKKATYEAKLAQRQKALEDARGNTTHNADQLPTPSSCLPHSPMALPLSSLSCPGCRGGRRAGREGSSEGHRGRGCC